MTTNTSLIETAKKKANRLALAARIAEHLHNAGFGISTIDGEGVRVFLTNRKLYAQEVQLALPDDLAGHLAVFEDYIRPEDTVLVAIKE